MRPTLYLVPLVLSLVLVSPVYAQQTRVIPAPGETPDVFVEVAEPGALGDFQVVALDPVTVIGDVVVKPADLMIYDRATGWALIVRNLDTPFSPVIPGVVGGPYSPFRECFQSVRLRPGIVWTPIALDRDNRTDLIGHDRTTGEVVRLYQRGTPFNCTY